MATTILQPQHAKPHTLEILMKTQSIHAITLASLLLSIAGSAQAGRADLVVIAQSRAGCTLYIDGQDLVSEGCNVHIRNGEGDTTVVNGLGNLLVGYDESDDGTHGAVDEKTGSHNLVVGNRHTYTSSGGFVAGSNNAVTAPGASVAGGYHNAAIAASTSVVGGYYNQATDTFATVTGGYDNESSGKAANVTGGFKNDAEGDFSVVSGGYGNAAIGEFSVVQGGIDAVATETAETVD